MQSKVIRILSIGNSYSQDQQTFVHQMAENAGIDLTVVNAYIGGCTFRKHLEQYETDAASYSFQLNGSTYKKQVTLRSILTAYKWDYVTFQLGTEGLSYELSNFPYVSRLMSIVREYVPDVEFVWNISWSDAENSNRSIFKNAYKSDRKVHWQSLVDQAKEAYEIGGFKLMTPVGIAMQYAYNIYGTKMHRDGFHSSELARYMAACVWFEFFTGLDAPDGYAPMTASYTGGILPNAEERAKLRDCAHRAVIKIKEYTETPDLFI